ncbi:MAG: hypothetical protein WBA97_27035 [Actinophytocola sp.]|uniref:hypothetical protein n=1 Tax=Actinophytocola sp. TaxID=1872138 RepID=UPI003C7574A5
MSAIPVTPTAPASARRPGVLVAAIGVTVVTALAAIVNGILIATGGKELVKDLLVQAGVPEVSDADLELFSNLAGYTSTDEFVSTFTTRGYLAAGAGAALLVFGLLMIKAGRAARILVTISAAFTMIFSLVILADETTSMMAGLAMLAILGAVVAVVFTWLPAIGRYAKALQG